MCHIIINQEGSMKGGVVLESGWEVAYLLTSPLEGLLVRIRNDYRRFILLFRSLLVGSLVVVGVVLHVLYY
jgi:helix-turn-helix protein